jgi:hypothetical protein
MSSPQTAPVIAKLATASVGLPPNATPNPECAARPAEAVSSTLELTPKPTGYGLPCAKCRTYYSADMAACPVCRTRERVLPLAVISPATTLRAEQPPDAEAVERERQRLLEELHLNVAARVPLPGGILASSPCTRDENHQTSAAPATVCQGCYEALQERVDVLEAVLHMEVKEAAEVIYDAVWADPSDPSKTYLNAAQAILGELRRRSGVPQVFGPLQPLLD